MRAFIEYLVKVERLVLLENIINKAVDIQFVLISFLIGTPHALNCGIAIQGSQIHYRQWLV